MLCLPTKVSGQKVKVYIEYVILDNFIIDYLLLKYTFILTRTKSSFWQLLLCSFLGTAFAVLLPLLSINAQIKTALKVVFSFLIVLSCGLYRSKKSFFICYFIFLTFTFLLGGGISGIFNIFNLSLDREYSIGIVIGLGYLLIKIITKIITFIYRKKTVFNYLYDCEIILKNVRLKVKGFLDTGNRLYENNENLPVILCNSSVAYNLTNGFKNKIKGNYLELTTVSGEEKIFVFKIDCIKIYQEDKTNIYNNVMLGISKRNFNDFDLLLHSELRG